MSNMPDWLGDLIVERVQRLFALGLNGHPPVELLAVTVDVWRECFETQNVTWDRALDQARITAAFSELQNTSEKWPVPKQLFEILRPRKAQEFLLLEERKRKTHDQMTPEELQVHQEQARLAKEKIEALKAKMTMGRKTNV